MNDKGLAPSGLSFSSSPDGFLVVRLMGDWKIGNPLPLADEVEKKLTAVARVKRVGFDTSDLKAWVSLQEREVMKPWLRPIAGLWRS